MNAGVRRHARPSESRDSRRKVSRDEPFPLGDERKTGRLWQGGDTPGKVRAVSLARRRGL
jgi:hypothetical protein